MSRRKHFAEHASPIDIQIEGHTVQAWPCRFTNGVGWCRGAHVPVRELERELHPYLSLNINVCGSMNWPADDCAPLPGPMRDQQRRFEMDFTRSEFTNTVREISAFLLDQSIPLATNVFRNGNVGWEGQLMFRAQVADEQLDCRATLQLWLVKSYQLPMGDQELRPSKSDLDCAIDDLTEAIELNPDDTRAYKDRAMVHIARAAWHLALSDLAARGSIPCVRPAAADFRVAG